MTLSSLEKVNNYPLYVMTYYGDYGFEEYLTTGQRSAMKIIYNIGPWQVSTNFIISECDDPGQAGCWRYNRTCSILSGNGGSVTSSSAMEILKSVSHDNTIWSVAYNLSSGDIRIATESEFSKTLFYNLYD